MIRIPLPAAELARARFAISPVYETVMAVSALIRPGMHGVHLPWARWARTRLTKVDPLLHALVSGEHYPAFLVPAPDSRMPSISKELTRVQNTPAKMAAEETARHTTRKPDLPRITAELRRVFELVIAPHWERMSRVLEADILYRSSILATGGMERLFADLHSDVIWRDSELIIHPHRPGEHLVQLRGQGIVLCPSVFCWPRVTSSTRPVSSGTLRYPARGVATLWEAPASSPSALSNLLGMTRAAILTGLAVPATTAELARQLEVTKGAVSQHLTVLREAGLVSTTRDGRSVLHLRTPAAEMFF